MEPTMEMIPLELQIKPFVLLIIVVCLITLNIIYRRTDESLGNRYEVFAFKGMLVSYMIYALVDLREIPGDKFYDLPRLPLLFIISLGFAAMSMSCYFWYLHVSSNLFIMLKTRKHKYLRLYTIVIHIPIAVVLLMLFTPLYTNVYELTDTVPMFKPGLSLILMMDYFYLISATILSIIYRRKAKTRHEKKKYGSQIIFIVAFTISGLLIGFLLNLPAIELVVMPVVLKLFMELQNSQIYTDPLTKLYNRRRMADFLKEELNTCSEDDPLTIVMIDMDFFKSINDILGHDEGDRALVALSDGLRDVVKYKNAIASRWGGDEFLVAGRGKDTFSNIREKLTHALRKSDLDYTLSFSIGTYSCTSKDTSIEEALALVDTNMYKDKEIRHQEADKFMAKLNSLAKKR